MKETIKTEPTELFTSLSLQNIGSKELKPIIVLLEKQHKVNCCNELKRIILNRILIDSIRYN